MSHWGVPLGESMESHTQHNCQATLQAAHPETRQAMHVGCGKSVHSASLSPEGPSMGADDDRVMLNETHD